MNYEVAKNNYLISTDKNKIDIGYVHGVLSQTYWSPGVAINVVKKAMKGSLCFGVYIRNKQIGYARLVSDKAKWLVEMILAHPDVKGLRSILLATRDAHGLYKKRGFIPVTNPERFMVYNPTGYKSK
jgi:hypothetical protein